MGGNAVKTIVLLMVLVVLSVMVGTQVSDSARTSIGAFAPIGAVVALFGMLLMGASSWKLIILLPPLAYLGIGNTGSMPFAQLVTIAVGLYWLVMWAMGYVRFKWNSLPLLDALIAIIFLYMIVSFYRHPVTLRALGLDYDYVGASPYILCLCSTLSYVVFSLIPWKLESLLQCLKWAFFISLFILLYKAFTGAAAPVSPEVGEADMGTMDVLQNGRFAFFSDVGTRVLFVVYGSFSLHRIISSWWRLGAVFFGVSGVMLSGWRTNMIRMFIFVGFLALLKRELGVLMSLALFVYVGLFSLSTSGALEAAPFGLQRVLTVLPGIHVSSIAADSASDSSDVRVKMWKNALDPRTGYIKDYIWGDGFQSSLSTIHRDNTARMRGRHLDQQDYMERMGAWHNGWVTFLHRTGIIGLVLFQSCLFLCVVYWYRLSFVLLRMKNGIFAVLYASGVLPIALTSCFLVVIVDSFFSVFTSISMVKILYCLLRERGLLQPMFSRRVYVPMVIREMESQAPVR